ncbi:hypothetical protein H0H93_011645 [Arthromyces matolae]|nr:hypothetical protein H0H93_011645 [Arthromyces matolae]
MSTTRTTLDLNHGWFWKQRNDSTTPVLAELDASSVGGILDSWRAAQAFPSEVHVELLKEGIIPDPYKGFNEHKVQWVGDVEWLYKCSFPFAKPPLHDHAVLEFQGLDTVCDVYLNGEHILSTDNQFRTYTYPISLNGAGTTLLKETNTLLLHFKSAKALAKAEEAKYGKGPELMTAGPYRPITLTTYSARLTEIKTRALVESDKETGLLSPTLKLNVVLEGSPVYEGLEVILKDTNGKEIKTQRVELQSRITNLQDVVHWELASDDVKLWWPVGYGEQNLYDVTVVLTGPNQQILDTQTKRIGFRSIELIQEPLLEADQYGTGTTFLFQVNGVRMFMGGSNWIPADNFLTTITEERYRAWLTLLRDGNQNMVRIWGGGIYEPDVFFDICDG